MQPRVGIEFGDNLWFVVEPKVYGPDQKRFTHDRVLPGYRSHVIAADAAIRYAIENDLPVEMRAVMIEDAETALEFFRQDLAGEDL
ncbi:hypothetical protein U5A82_17505 [Sphingobium sp. CR2-8]|uniref:hypothetical protein n=1 Tax=Sphingobium sp. CR2-8 TaxID=1306534 RepID=UPI002DB88F47|nr:hypothetical protein [Sphingobium sp. CR2-8]MEC3912206.1 hypothetical protein [Sphingobium sp. CR2-8]